jgi:hypothetical protein
MCDLTRSVLYPRVSVSSAARCQNCLAARPHRRLPNSADESCDRQFKPHALGDFARSMSHFGRASRRCRIAWQWPEPVWRTALRSGGPAASPDRPGRVATRFDIIRVRSTTRRAFANRRAETEKARKPNGARSCRCATRPVHSTRSGHPTCCRSSGAASSWPHSRSWLIWVQLSNLSHCQLFIAQIGDEHAPRVVRDH